MIDENKLFMLELYIELISISLCTESSPSFANLLRFCILRTANRYNAKHTNAQMMATLDNIAAEFDGNCIAVSVDGVSVFLVGIVDVTYEY
jgi:hypothetical protein